MTRKKPEELEFKEPDKSISHVLDYFYEIKNCKGEKITYSELKSYQDVMNVRLAPWQCETIMKIDSIFESSVYG